MMERSRHRILWVLPFASVTILALATAGYHYRHLLQRLPTTDELVQDAKRNEERSESASAEPVLTNFSQAPHPPAEFFSQDFTVTYTINDMPGHCRTVFNRAFTYASTAGPKAIELVNPGVPFAATDVVTDGLARRRLEFVGFNNQECFIYYQHGGSLYTRFCLVIMQDGDNKPVWASEMSSKAADLKSLRSLLLDPKIQSHPRMSC